jgi:hypothetical protein
MKATPMQTMERIAGAMRGAADYEGRGFAANLCGALHEIQRGLPTEQQNKVRSMCNAARRAVGLRRLHGADWDEE